MAKKHTIADLLGLEIVPKLEK
eukprot:Gb_31569 [translate_table: standard]